MSEGPVIEAAPAGSDGALWRRLLREGRAAYRVEARVEGRRRTRLQSAKVLDANGAFLCDASIRDISPTGLRLALSRNCGLPSRFGVHLDLTGEVLTATCVWRRDREIGAQVIVRGPPSPLSAQRRAALAGRYYALRG